MLTNEEQTSAFKYEPFLNGMMFAELNNNNDSNNNSVCVVGGLKVMRTEWLEEMEDECRVSLQGKAQNQGDVSKRLGGVLAAASGRWGGGGVGDKDKGS